MNYFVPARAYVMVTLHRFPATVLSCLLFCSLGIYNNHMPGVFWAEISLGMSFIASVLFTVSQLFFEGVPLRPKWIIYLVVLLVLASMTLYCGAITHVVPFQWSFILFAIAALALVPVAPSINRRTSSDQVFTFSFALARQIMFASIISAITLIGLVAIAVSIGKLFDLRYPVVIADIGVVIASVLFSGLVLVGVPHDGERDEFPVGAQLVQMLIGCVVIPLLLVYGGILYWYFLVLCFTQSLPAGVIVYMVGGFFGVGIFVYLALDHSKTHEMVIIKRFRKYFFRLLPVPLFLMTLSIGIRVHEHGLTGLRFIVVMMVTWFIFVTIFSFTNSKKYLSRFVYLSAAIMALITAFSLSCFTSSFLRDMEGVSGSIRSPVNGTNPGVTAGDSTRPRS